MEKITNLKGYEAFLTMTGMHVATFLIDEEHSIFSVWINYDYSHKVQVCVPGD